MLHMHTQVARRQVALVLVPPESHPKIRNLEQVPWKMCFAKVGWRASIEIGREPRKGAFQERLRELNPAGELCKPIESYLSYHV